MRFKNVYIIDLDDNMHVMDVKLRRTSKCGSSSRDLSASHITNNRL